MFEKKKVQDWITELGLALDAYSGNIKVDGVYKKEYKPFIIASILKKQRFSNEEKEFVKLIVEDTISLYGKDNKDKYSMYLEEELESIREAKSILKVSLSLDGTGLNKEVKKLRENGYKVKLYSVENDKNFKKLIAIKKDTVKYDLEKPFIKIRTEYSAKDFIKKEVLK